jgi:hypothetical protein
MWVGGQRHAPAALPPGERPRNHCTGGWVGPRSVWTDAENLAPHRDSIPGPSSRSESLYRLSYRGPHRLPVRSDKFLFRPNVWGPSTFLVKYTYGQGGSLVGDKTVEA